MIRRVRRVVVLMDSSKWGIRGRLKVASAAMADVVVTDAPPPEEIGEELSRLGVELMVADPDAKDTRPDQPGG